MTRFGDLLQAQQAGTALQLKKAKGFEGPSKGWLVIEEGEIRNLRTGESVPVAGAHAAVDSAGQLESRITATRLALTGPFALALRKKKDSRELFLAVQGPDGGLLVEVDPKKQAQARRFALAVNTEAAKPASLPEPNQLPVAADPVPSANGDAFDQIRQLGKLRDEGLITEQEFEAKKADLLGKL